MTTKIPVELSSTPGIVDGSNATAITIDSSERVGIGTSTPGSFDSEANNLVVGSGSGDEGITIFTGSSVGDYGSIFFADATGSPKQGQIRYEQNNEVMSFFTNATERMRIQLGGGISFNGDTAAANALDDYEEGTWTPNLIGTTGSAGSYATGGTPNANYTKIGRVVTIQCTFYISNKGSYTGKTIVTGLPFTCATSTSAVVTHSFPDTGYGTTSGNVLIGGAVQASDNKIAFYDGSRLDARHDYADVGTGYYVNLSGSYMAAT